MKIGIYQSPGVRHCHHCGAKIKAGEMFFMVGVPTGANRCREVNICITSLNLIFVKKLDEMSQSSNK